MATRIKLQRRGRTHAPYYRVVVADARRKRGGKAIENIGRYHPTEEPSLIEIDSDRAQYWLSVGAQPTDPVRKLLTLTGDIARFNGKKDAESRVKVAPEKADQKARYESQAKKALELKTDQEQQEKAAKAEKKAAKKKDSEKAEKKTSETKAAESKDADSAKAESAEKPASDTSTES